MLDRCVVNLMITDGCKCVSACDWQVGALANKEDCPSGQYTTSGECCLQCQPGEGVVRRCGVAQTVCAPCLDSE